MSVTDNDSNVATPPPTSRYDALTPAAYARLSRADREAVPADVLDQLRADQEREMEAITAQRLAALPPSDPATNAAFRALTAEMSPPLSSNQSLLLKGRDKGPEHCPHARQIFVESDTGGAAILAPCRSRTCEGYCGARWIDTRAYSVHLLTIETGRRYELYRVAGEQWATLSKAMQRHRRAGRVCNGMKAQTGLNSEFTVLVERDEQDYKPLSRTLVAVPVADPVLATIGILAEAQEVAREVDDAGQCRGLGDWNGQMTPPDFEPIERGKVVGTCTYARSKDELVTSIRSFGGQVGVATASRVEYTFADPVDQAAWYASLGFTEDRWDRNIAPF